MNSEIIIYQNAEGNIKTDVRLDPLRLPTIKIL